MSFRVILFSLISLIVNFSSPIELKELVPITISSPSAQPSAEATYIVFSLINALEMSTVQTVLGALPKKFN